MSLVVVGSIAFDSIKSPFGERTRALGGSAVHFALAAAYFSDVRVVGPVGDDFGDDQYAVLHRHGVNTDDIERVPGGKTFFWAGEYEWNLNIRHTLDTQLGVFGEFEPKLSEGSKQADVLFLANIQPDLQREVRAQCTGAKVAGLDSMNYWITSARESLLETIGVVDLLLDERRRGAHAHRGADPPARRAQADGARTARGRGQAGRVRRLAVHRGRVLLGPRVPARDGHRPDGRRRLLRRRLFGYLDSAGRRRTDDATLRRAMIYSSAVASFWVEEFGLRARESKLKHEEIDERYEAFRRIRAFHDSAEQAVAHPLTGVPCA